MKKVLFLFLIISTVACQQKKHIPDVSAIHINLEVIRFDKDFFSLDTNHLSQSLDILHTKYPSFLKDYLYNILAALPQPDSVLKYVRLFRKEYQYIDDSVQQTFPSFDQYRNQVQDGFRFIHYYFPGYQLPSKIITFIGPLEGTANALTSTGIAVGLQSYLGENFPAYQSQYISEVYPAYKSRRFEPRYIAVNCIRNIIDDMYPDKSLGRPLIERMIEAGKRLYLLDAFLPETADTLKTGYTEQQLKGCYDHEKNIWGFFVQNNLLYETELSLVAPYVNDGPDTPELGAASPGFIGQFTGWQIVKKWMRKNDKKTMKELMETSAAQIFEEAKYQP